MKKKKKNKISIWIYVLVVLVGGGLLLYPTVANAWNSRHSAKVVEAYQESVKGINEDEFNRLLAEAEAYNQDLYENFSYALGKEKLERYNSMLDFTGLGVMGTLEIPSINVSLPIYHGCDDSVLQSGAGHLEWSSLPVGGRSTHAVISGHRGLPSAKLLTNLDLVQPGDIFVISVLGRELTYLVDNIFIVEPEDLSNLTIQEGKDLCTLVTCTPYGINTHRLLVQGHRVENLQEVREIRITADAMQVEAYIVAPLVAIPLLILIVFTVLALESSRKRRKRKRKHSH